MKTLFAIAVAVAGLIPARADVVTVEATGIGTNSLPMFDVSRSTSCAALVKFTGSTTNATGSIVLVASNSVDSVNWFRDSARDITVPFNGNSLVNYQTNFTGLVYPYEQWTLQNPSTTQADASGFQMKVKN